MAIIKIGNPAIDLDAAEIPNLDTAKITTGQFTDSRIADVAATKITGTITPSDSTVSLAKLTATGTKDATTFLRGDNTFAAAGGGVDTIFNVVKNVDQTSISDGTLTKITNWTADVDTGSGWDNTNHKFVIPANKSGKYLIGATITQSQSGGGNSIADTYDIMIFKNGSVVFTNCDKNRPALDWCTSHITTILDLAAADELEIYTKVTAGGGSTTVREHSDYQASNRCTNWYGCKLA